MIIKFALQFFDVVLIIFPRAIIAYGSCFSKFMRNSTDPLHTNGGHAKGERPACVILVDPVSGSALGKGGPGEGEHPGD